MPDTNIPQHLLARFNVVDAVFWDCDEDAESLTNSEPLEALQEAVDSWLEPECTPERAKELIRAVGSFTVYPFKRVALNADVWAENVLDNLIDALCEDEELTDPDGDWDPIPVDLRAKYEPLFRALMRDLCAEIMPWACERVGLGVTFTADEVIELLPDLFADLALFEQSPATEPSRT